MAYPEIATKGTALITHPYLGRYFSMNFNKHPLPAQTETTIIKIGGPGSVEYGSICLYSYSHNLRSLNISINNDDNKVINNLYNLFPLLLRYRNPYSLTFERIHEEFTEAGSWASSSKGKFVYMLQLPQQRFETGFELVVMNDYTDAIYMDANISYSVVPQTVKVFDEITIAQLRSAFNMLTTQFREMVLVLNELVGRKPAIIVPTIPPPEVPPEVPPEEYDWRTILPLLAALVGLMGAAGVEEVPPPGI